MVSFDYLSLLIANKVVNKITAAGRPEKVCICSKYIQSFYLLNMYLLSETERHELLLG